MITIKISNPHKIVSNIKFGTKIACGFGVILRCMFTGKKNEEGNKDV
jgi:hypothetical protein